MRITREELQALRQANPGGGRDSGVSSRGTGADRPRIAPERPRKAATRKERDIQAAILEYLATVPGVYAWKSGAGMFPMAYKGKTRMVRMGQPGVSDLIGWVQKRVEVNVGGQWRPGARQPDDAPIAQFFACEIKKPGRYPTVEQQAFLDRVTAAGGIAICARSVSDVARGLGLQTS